MEIDPRWIPLADLQVSILQDLAYGIAVFESHDPSTTGLDRFRDEKSMQKGFQDAYSSIEQLLERVLTLAGEERPVGPHSHADLLSIATQPTRRRPGFASELFADLDELRSFRHVAVHNYRRFSIPRAEPTVIAARRVVAGLPLAMERFGREFGLLPPA